jgi:hypothetical protein
MERVIAAAEARDDYNTPREREETLAYLERALNHYRGLANSGEADAE